MNPYLWIAAAAAAIVALGGAYLQGRSDGQDKCQAEAARDERVAQVAGAAVAEAVASGIAQIKVRNTTIKQEVQHEIVETVRYRECVHPDSVLRNINATLAGEPAPAASGVMPATDAPGGADVR